MGGAPEDTSRRDRISFEGRILWAVYGCFLKWWYPQNTPKWSFLVGKTHGSWVPPFLGNPPYYGHIRPFEWKQRQKFHGPWRLSWLAHFRPLRSWMPMRHMPLSARPTPFCSRDPLQMIACNGPPRLGGEELFCCWSCGLKLWNPYQKIRVAKNKSADSPQGPGTSWAEWPTCGIDCCHSGGEGHGKGALQYFNFREVMERCGKGRWKRLHVYTVDIYIAII